VPATDESADRVRAATGLVAVRPREVITSGHTLDGDVGVGAGFGGGGGAAVWVGAGGGGALWVAAGAVALVVGA